MLNMPVRQGINCVFNAEGIFRAVVLVLVLFSGIFMGTSQTIRMMSYNIRYATNNDGENRWENRKEFLGGQVAFFNPGIFGIQEGLAHQVNYLNEKFTDYSYIGVGRDDGAQKGEYCAIFYNSEKFELLEQGTFWLSSSPDRVSVGWDAALERICTYGSFVDKAKGVKFWVFNTHFDHRGELAREESAKLIAQKIIEINKENLPFVLMGDFNLNEQSGAIKYLSSMYNDSRSASKNKPFGPFGTFNGFQFHDPVQDRIDYIFCSKDNIQVEKYAVLTDSKDGKYPSDHFPVFVELSFTKE